MMPMFFPVPTYVSSIDSSRGICLKDLCEKAGVRCRASGQWVDRRIHVASVEEGAAPAIEAEPGSAGAVRITTPAGITQTQSLQYALAAMAYSLFDLVARESIKGVAWARPDLPVGRKRNGRAKSNAARQRKFQAKRREISQHQAPRNPSKPHCA